MIRVVVENILLFLMPTLVWTIYTYAKRRRDEDATLRQVLSAAPLAWLFATGTVLMLTVLVLFGSTSGGRPGQSYEPPSMKNGQIEPGRIK